MDELRKAGAALTRADDWAAEAGDRARAVQVAAWRSRLALLQGDIEQARRWSAVVWDEWHTPNADPREQLDMLNQVARVWLAIGEEEQLPQLFAAANRVAAGLEWPEGTAELGRLEASWHLGRGDMEGAGRNPR